MRYTLEDYTDRYRKEYLDSQVEAFKGYVIEFFGKFKLEKMEEHLDKLLKQHLKRIVVDNSTAGFVYYNNSEDGIVLDAFTLLPEYRNVGLGSEIMKDFIEIANREHKTITLDTFKTNPAKRFYERHGFVVVDENYSHYILRYNPKSE